MPILLRTQVDRTDKTPVTARRARVGGLCGFRSPAERVPAGSPKTGRCADVRERCRSGKCRANSRGNNPLCNRYEKTAKVEKSSDFGRCGEKAARKRRESGEKAARKQDKAAGVVRAPRRSHLPAVRAVSGIYEGVPNTAKNSWRALRNEKSPPFQGKQRGSNEKHEVNTEKW